jgi:hypothetical protein
VVLQSYYNDVSQYWCNSLDDVSRRERGTVTVPERERERESDGYGARESDGYGARGGVTVLVLLTCPSSSLRRAAVSSCEGVARGDTKVLHHTDVKGYGNG